MRTTRRIRRLRGLWGTSHGPVQCHGLASSLGSGSGRRCHGTWSLPGPARLMVIATTIRWTNYSQHAKNSLEEKDVGMMICMIREANPSLPPPLRYPRRYLAGLASHAGLWPGLATDTSHGSQSSLACLPGPAQPPPLRALLRWLLAVAGRAGAEQGVRDQLIRASLPVQTSTSTISLSCLHTSVILALIESCCQRHRAPASLSSTVPAHGTRMTELSHNITVTSWTQFTAVIPTSATITTFSVQPQFSLSLLKNNLSLSLSMDNNSLSQSLDSVNTAVSVAGEEEVRFYF